MHVSRDAGQYPNYLDGTFPAVVLQIQGFVFEPASGESGLAPQKIAEKMNWNTADR